jgi:DNA-binding FrmR family transcriptional regulator
MAGDRSLESPGGAESRYRPDNADILQRLREIDGQVGGAQRMVEEDRSCVDVLVQMAAIRSALGAVAQSLLETQVRGCVAPALRNGDGEAGVLEVIAQFSR